MSTTIGILRVVTPGELKPRDYRRILDPRSFGHSIPGWFNDTTTALRLRGIYREICNAPADLSRIKSHELVAPLQQAFERGRIVAVASEIDPPPATPLLIERAEGDGYEAGPGLDGAPPLLRFMLEGLPEVKGAHPGRSIRASEDETALAPDGDSPRAAGTVTPPVVPSAEPTKHLRDLVIRLSDEYLDRIGAHLERVDGLRYRLFTDRGDSREGIVRERTIREADIGIDQGISLDFDEPIPDHALPDSLP